MIDMRRRDCCCASTASRAAPMLGGLFCSLRWRRWLRKSTGREGPPGLSCGEGTVLGRGDTIDTKSDGKRHQHDTPRG
jgi:hypothetical protein